MDVGLPFVSMDSLLSWENGELFHVLMCITIIFRKSIACRFQNLSIHAGQLQYYLMGNYSSQDADRWKGRVAKVERNIISSVSIFPPTKTSPLPIDIRASSIFSLPTLSYWSKNIMGVHVFAFLLAVVTVLRPHFTHHFRHNGLLFRFHS